MGFLRDSFGTEHVTWVSPLGVDAATQALADVGLRPTGQFMGSGGPLRGRCGPPTVVARRRSFLNNSWRPLLRGELTPTATGSRLDAAIKLSTSTNVFMAIWMVAAIIIAVFGVVVGVARAQPSAVMALLMPAMGVGISVIGTQFSYGDRAFLRTTIGSAIIGTEISTQGATT